MTKKIGPVRVRTCSLHMDSKKVKLKSDYHITPTNIMIKLLHTKPYPGIGIQNIIDVIQSRRGAFLRQIFQGKFQGLTPT